MKHGKELILCFISHMVQMKAIEYFKSKGYTFSLYIPHGSDERDYPRSASTPLLPLYIPHGSDERGCIVMASPQKENFISHMVQMKETPLDREIISTISFISHMVQMKVKQLLGTFRMELELYIPHGSDESRTKVRN